MNISLQILLALVLALILGVVVSTTQSATLNSIIELIEPIGTLWVNAIRMIVIPLLISLLITAVAGQQAQHNVAKVGGHSGLIIVLLVAMSSLLTFIMAPLFLSFITIDPQASQQLLNHSTTSITDTSLPAFSEWFTGLIPINPFKSAVDNAMLPLMVFIALFALSLRHIDETHRKSVTMFFEGIKQSMFVLIGWIMKVAPYGIFALVLSLTSKLGVSTVTVLATFIAVTSLIIVLITLILYLLVFLFGGVSMLTFIKAVAPVQVIGFSTRSSLASLPATYDATQKLGLPSDITGVVLPIAVTMFKFASPIARISGTYFIANLYGIDLSVYHMMVIAMAIGLLSFYSPGIPSGGLLIMSPVYLSLGLPVEGIGILIAVDLIIDMFITAANVTANVSAAVLVSRLNK